MVLTQHVIYIYIYIGGSSIAKASKKFGIPKMTLSDKMNNRCPHKKSDRMTELTKMKKKALWLPSTTHYPYQMWKHLLGAFPFGRYAREGPDEAFDSILDNGYLNSTSFYVFMDQLFIPKTKHIPGQKVLISNGHGSHLDINNLDIK